MAKALSVFTLLLPFSILIRETDARYYQSHQSAPAKQWRKILLSGTLYGSQQYMTRSRYLNNPNREYGICENYKAKDSNGTVYGKFICPMWNNTDEQDKCCGPSQEQYCCTFWDDSGRTAGAIVGFVLAGLVLIGIVVLIAICCVMPKKTRTSSCPAQRRCRGTWPPWAGGCRFKVKPEASKQSQLTPGEARDHPPAYGFSESNYSNEYTYSSPDTVKVTPPPAYDEIKKY